MRDLYRLVYTSFRKEFCDDLEIKKILESCKKNNPGRGITGILLHSDSRFIQYMEGSREDVTALYEKIKNDPRHTSINQRNFEKIEERVFPSWEMGYRDVSRRNIEFHTDISDEDMESFEKLIGSELDFTNDGMRVLQLFFRS